MQAVAGDLDAAESLVRRLSPMIQAYCRRRFGNRGSTKSGTDFANEALVAFHGQLALERLGPDLKRKDLLAYLIGLAWKKHLQNHRAETTAKRGGGRVVQQSSLAQDDATRFEQESRFLEPETLTANCRELLDPLPDDLCLIAIRRLQGYALRDIASELECHASTIKRKLNVIRSKWLEFLDSGD